ncbi:high light inducible protein [bacterium]|nr:high light inducible protein [bacterium]
MRNNRSNYSWLVLMTNTKTVEKEKVIAEKLNGRFAMMGFIALVGAYLTTGQIIPGFV